jgi:hypothetical protein
MLHKNPHVESRVPRVEAREPLLCLHTLCQATKDGFEPSIHVGQRLDLIREGERQAEARAAVVVHLVIGNGACEKRAAFV